MKHLTLFKFLILLLVFNPLTIQAEGTSSIAPSLADEAALFIGAGNTGGNGGDYGQFAWKGSSSKLFFNIQNSCEKVYIGFSDPVNDRSFNLVSQNGGSGIERDLIFRILDPTGNPINNLSCFGNTTINGEVWQTLNEFTANIDNRLQTDNGPNQLGVTNGYDAFVLDLSACGINITGNYAIEFYSTDANYNPNTAGAGFYIPFFDITVADCANQGMTGRVWSNNWGIGIKRDGDGSFDRAFNGQLYICSTEGFITKIDFNTGINTRAEAGKNTDQRSGFRAGSFNISFNQRGPGTSGNIVMDRQSVQNANLTNPLLPVFLNLPDEAFCPVQELGEIKAATNFLTGCPEDRCINVAATQPGQFEIIIEGANGNGILDQPTERSLVYVITDADKVANPETLGYLYEACIPWDGKDGKDGNGNTLLEVAVTITGNYFQGIYHFPVYDAEFNDDGFIVETVRPALGRQLLYYDDTNITELNNTSEAKDGTNGCVGPCHRWTGEWEDYTNADDNFGNFNTINTWWFASTSSQNLTGALGELEPLTINCPAAYNGCTTASIDPSITGSPAINFADDNCAYTLDYTDVEIANTCEGKTIERTWVAYFNNNPSDRRTCIQKLILVAPVLSNCPNNVVIGCNDSRVYSWQAPTITGTCGGTVVQTSGPASGSTFPEGTTTVTYQVADGCGVTQTCSFTVTVESSGSVNDLTLACPSDYTGCTDDTVLPSITGTATVKTTNTGTADVADTNCPYIIDYTDVYLENSCSGKTIERTWSVYFANNPSVRKTCTQTITLIAPVLSNCPSNVVIGCNDSRVYSWQAPTITGTCGGTVVQTSGPASGSTFPEGTTTVTYQLSNGCGVIETCSFTVTVNTGQISDLSITCPPNFASCTNQSTDPSSTGTATVTTTNSACPYILDYSDLLLEDECASKTIQRTWYVYYANNPSQRKTCTQTITIDGLTLANCPSDAVLDCQEGNVYTWQPPTGVGACGSCSDTVEVANFLYMGERGGHRYYCSRTKATWQDAKAIAESMNGYLVVLDDPAENAFCAGFLVNQFAHIGLTDEGTEGDFRWINGAAVNYTNWFEDQPNNHENKQHYGQLVTDGKWNDSDGSEVLEYIVEVPCADIRQTSGPLNGSAFPNGTSTVTYEIGDGCGTTETCSFNVTVEGGLTIECPNDVILGCENSQNGASYSWTPPKASSCCDNCPSEGQDIAGFVYMGSYNGHQYYCSREKASWAAAKATSEATGGYLAVINDAGENQLLANFLTEQSAFIGLHDSNQEGQFEWLSGESMAYTNWYPGQPNNYQGRQDHVRLLQNGQWDDTYAHVELEYIMEMPCRSIQQIEGPANGSIFPIGTTDVAYLIEDACGNQEICDFKVTVNPCDQVADYCGSGSSNTNFFWIRHVVCGAINQVSTSQGGYSNFTNQQTAMKAGSSQTIILSPGFGPTKYYVNWRVWIDYNRDGDFEDVYEEVLTYRHYNILKLKFTVPQQCGVGPTRMRVAMKYFSPANSCESFTYGEVEDYTVNLQPSGENLFEITGSDRTNNEVEVEIIEHESTAPIMELLVGEKTNLTIYPNPVSAQLKVDLTDYSGVAGRLRIYNKLGQKVMEREIGLERDQHFALAVDKLPNGLYLLSIESENGEAIVQKFNKH